MWHWFDQVVHRGTCPFLFVRTRWYDMLFHIAVLDEVMLLNSPSAPIININKVTCKTHWTIRIQFFHELKGSIQQRPSLFSSKKVVECEHKVSLKREDYRHILNYLLPIAWNKTRAIVLRKLYRISSWVTAWRGQSRSKSILWIETRFSSWSTLCFWLKYFNVGNWRRINM